jgi:carotenoid cleavage dioxygenase
LKYLFVTANAWEEGDEVVLITCRLENPDLDKVNGHQNDKLENFGNELYVPAISNSILI